MVAYQLDDEPKSLYRKNEKRGETHHLNPFPKLVLWGNSGSFALSISQVIHLPAVHRSLMARVRTMGLKHL